MLSGNFIEAVVDLSGQRPALCLFERCTLVADAPTPAADWGGNQFLHCRFVGTGWPDWIKSSGFWQAA